MATGCPPAISCGDKYGVICLNGSVLKGGQDVFFFEERVVLQNLAVGCTGTKQAENVRDTNALPTNAGMPAALAGFYRDAFESFRAHGNFLCVKLILTHHDAICIHCVERTTRVLSRYAGM